MSDIWTPKGAIIAEDKGLDSDGFGGWRRDQAAERRIREMGLAVEPGTRCYYKGECAVMSSRHPDTRRRHLSISCRDRDPSWEEIKDARYSLMPKGIYVAQILPPPDSYLNVMEHCFHLYEIDQPEEIR